MRAKILIALVATAIGMSSCELMNSSEPSINRFQLQGAWRLDSIVATPGKKSIGLLAIVALKPARAIDTTPITVKFSGDNVVSYTYGKVDDTATYTLRANKMVVKSKKDKTTSAFRFLTINDSTFAIASKDSSTLFFKRSR